jgi:hypothetical protein
MKSMKTKQAKPKILLFAFGMALIGCSTVEPTLPVGMYRENAGPNFIDVSTNTMRVHIEGADSRDENGTGMTFEYALWPDGRLWLVVSRSVELMYGYPGLEYHWDGGKIIARDFRSERKWEFAPRPPEPPAGHNRGTTGSP